MAEEQGKEAKTLALQAGDEVPNFVADSTVGKFGYHDMVDGVWGVLVTFADVFDSVATTELGMLTKLGAEFEARNARVVGVVPLTTRALTRKWIAEVEELEACKVSVPVVVDADASIVKDLGLVKHGTDDDLVPATCVVVTDIDRRVRLCLQYPRTTGRNFYEVLRALDALQLAFFHQVAAPANWTEGQDVILQSHLSTLAARNLFPKGTVELRPWYRTTPQPDRA